MLVLVLSIGLAIFTAAQVSFVWMVVVTSRVHGGGNNPYMPAPTVARTHVCARACVCARVRVRACVRAYWA